MPVQPWRFFQLLGEELLKPGFGYILLAYKESECIAASIFLRWKNVLTYKFGASSFDGLIYRPNNLIMWAAIQWGCENGCSLLDFGRTEIENKGLRKFKNGFGAQEMPLVYSFLSGKAIRAGKKRLYNFMHYLIHHTPPWFCRAAGEAFYRFGA